MIKPIYILGGNLHQQKHLVFKRKTDLLVATTVDLLLDVSLRDEEKLISVFVLACLPACLPACQLKVYLTLLKVDASDWLPGQRSWIFSWIKKCYELVNKKRINFYISDIIKLIKTEIWEKPYSCCSITPHVLFVHNSYSPPWQKLTMSCHSLGEGRTEYIIFQVLPPGKCVKCI